MRELGVQCGEEGRRRGEEEGEVRRERERVGEMERQLQEARGREERLRGEATAMREVSEATPTSITSPREPLSNGLLIKTPP